jgi:hypothetical protein
MATEGVNSSHFDPPTPLHISQPERPGFFRDDNRPHSSCRSAASDDDDTRPVLTHTAKVIIAVVVFALGVLAGAAVAAWLFRPHELPGEGRRDRACFRDLLDKLNDRATQLPVFDAHKRLYQVQALGSGEEVAHVGGSGSIGRPSRAGRDAGRDGCALKEKRNRHPQNLGDVLQAARTEAVRPFLVFLNLLKGNPEGVSELSLAHIEDEPSHAYTAADMLVGRINTVSISV